MVVAWGRLDGQFTSTLLTLMGIAGPDSTGKNILPNSFDKRINKWRELFNSIAGLDLIRGSALAIASEVKKISEIRNIVLHSMWQDFTIGLPLGLEYITMKHLSKSINKLEVSRGVITIDYLNEITAGINQLNLNMVPISIFISKRYRH